LATFIDHVRCGGCDAGLTLEPGNVVVQRYRRQPWMGHFWVHCDACATHRLYWASPRQARLAQLLKCHTRLDDEPSGDVAASYAEVNGRRAVTRRAPVDIPTRELGFLVQMLAATSWPHEGKGPTPSYLPSSWAN
jgi:hypothetical protein